MIAWSPEGRARAARVVQFVPSAEKRISTSKRKELSPYRTRLWFQSVTKYPIRTASFVVTTGFTCSVAM